MHPAQRPQPDPPRPDPPPNSMPDAPSPDDDDVDLMSPAPPAIPPTSAPVTPRARTKRTSVEFLLDCPIDGNVAPAADNAPEVGAAGTGPSPPRRKRTREIARESDVVLDDAADVAPPSKRARSHPRAARPSPAPTKRPRVSSTKKNSKPKVALKTLKPPHKSFPRAKEGEPVCAFCCIPGKQRAVEGALLGPYQSEKGRSFYGHYNCMLWAPEVWLDESTGTFKGVDLALKRARSAKCRLCGDGGSTLACMFRGKVCCRPMHFRCALLKGANLILNGRSFQTLCPVHAGCGVALGDPPVARELLHVQTPVPPEFLAADSFCTVCDADNYDPDKGALLHCDNCDARVHSKCLCPTMDFDGAYAVLASEGKFLCKKCLVCDICKESVPDRVTDDIVQCCKCHHRTVHKTCAGDGVKDGFWRCDVCRICRHCQVKVENAAEWSEPRQACGPCDAAHEGGTICPTCNKVWREGPMIQCDGCDLWLHDSPECSNLTPEEAKAMQNNDKKYFCPPCVKKKESAITSVRPPRTKRPSKPNGRARARRKGEDLDMEANVTLEYASSDEEDGAEFQFNQKSSAVPLDVGQLVAEAAPHAEFCLQCGSGGPDASFRFCAGCGEALHGFCVGTDLPERASGPFISAHSGTVYRVAAGGTGPGARLWRCTACTACKSCGASESDENPIVLCDHCNRGVHLSCLSPPLEKPPEGSFKCDECIFCEMCGDKELDTVLVREHSFCPPCSKMVEEAKPCVVCNVRYPLLGVLPQAILPQDTSPAGTPELPRAFLTGAKCSTCASVVHAACDVNLSADTEYHCPHCREPLVGNTAPELKRTPISSCSPPSTPDDCVHQLAGTAMMEGVTLPVTEEVDISHPAPAPYASQRWSVDPEDRRECEFCRLGESDDEVREHDRLLPFAPDPGCNGPHVWVHAGCMLWTSGVERINDVGRKLVLLSNRRVLLSLARTSFCTVCKERGATLECTEQTCTNVYHLHCGIRARMQCVTHEKDENSKDPNPYPRRDLYCFEHGALRSEATPLQKVHAAIPLSRSVRMARARSLASLALKERNGRFDSLKDGIYKEKALVRVGALTVVKLGRLVPDSSEFVVRGVLIPTGYCATRLFWSMTQVAQRTMYYMETSGDSSSGPIFAVWPADYPDLVLQNTCADKLWKTVEERVESLRGNVANRAERMFCRDAPSGLEAFGLTKCRPVVTLIESLPLGWMFKERYNFKFRQPVAVSQDAVNVISGAEILRNIKVKEPETGCARTEGYVPKRHRKRLKDESLPLIENMRSGELFQLKVAMEAEGQGDYAPQVRGMQGSNSSFYNANRVAFAANSYGGEMLAGYGSLGKRKIGEGETNVANLPYATQYRMMRERGKKTIVLRSRIEGLGVFATDVFKPHEMIIEYVGDVIRPAVSDPREHLYNRRGIGCYMFTITAGESIVDATMKGNAARFINHSCEPNCYSKHVFVENGAKIVAIFAKRFIKRGEELSYDYLFPLDEADKALCGCGSTKCKGFMN